MLDLAAARAELELTAAVERDPALSTRVVEVEEVATEPKRDGFELRQRGCDASASTSATEWIGKSHVSRSRCGSSTGRVSSVSRASSSQASGKASATRP